MIVVINTRRCRAQLFGGASAFDGKPSNPLQPNVSGEGWLYCRMFRQCARARRKPDIAVAIVQRRPFTFSQASISLRTAATEKPLMMDKSDMIRPNCGANFLRVAPTSRRSASLHPGLNRIFA